MKTSTPNAESATAQSPGSPPDRFEADAITPEFIARRRPIESALERNANHLTQQQNALAAAEERGRQAKAKEARVSRAALVDEDADAIAALAEADETRRTAERDCERRRTLIAELEAERDAMAEELRQLDYAEGLVLYAASDRNTVAAADTVERAAAALKAAFGELIDAVNTRFAIGRALQLQLPTPSVRILRDIVTYHAGVTGPPAHRAVGSLTEWISIPAPTNMPAAPAWTPAALKRLLANKPMALGELAAVGTDETQPAASIAEAAEPAELSAADVEEEVR